MSHVYTFFQLFVLSMFFFLGKGFRSTKISRVSLMHCDSLLDEGQMICIRAITSNTTTVKTWLSHKKGLVINP